MSGTTRLQAAHTAAADIPRPKPRWRKMLTGWNMVGFILLGAAIGISLWQVNSVDKQLYGSDIAVVRISHWQLELGYRNALQTVIDNYNKLQDEKFAKGEIKRKVQVVQLPVSEKTYGQLINTNLIAGTAPDLIEMGFSSMISGAYRAQYFLNLSSEIEKPNRYNAKPFQSPKLPADLVDKLPVMPWRETFLDGMIGGFDKDLQSYYMVPTTFAPGGRLAVNLDMLKEATGSDVMPTTLGQLLDACDKMRELGKKRGKDIWPIAGSSYSARFYGGYITPFLAKSQAGLDADHDGSVTLNEVLMAMRLGKWTLDDPAVGNLIDATRAVASQFPNGFLGMDREGAMLMFTQLQSGFLYCGAWDAGTVYRLSQGKFRVGIMNDVVPGPGEKWGPLTGVNEASMPAACAYGINKTSPNWEIALDFLHFWTSQAQNQAFNEEAQWVPCIVGSKVPGYLAAYAPRIAGHFSGSAWLISYAEQMSNTFDGQMQSVLTGRADKESVIAKMKEVQNDKNYGIDAVIEKKDEDLRTNERNAERGIDAQGLAQLLAPDRAAATSNYVILVSTQAQNLNGRSGLAVRRCTEEILK